jgi:2-polyprenyl-3-methyl-5-hydroxy-6-metoxy-1,4-benzoquinol methylase
MQCRICSNEKDNASYEAQEMMFGYRDAFCYFQCSKCNCLQIGMIPSDMSRYYPENYSSHKLLSNLNQIKQFIINLRNKYAVLNIGLIGKLLYARYPHSALRSLCVIPLRKDSNILDVGCGEGKLLCSVSELGFKNLLGVDPLIKKDIQYRNGLKILRKTIHDVEDKWDLIMFHHSFEHLPDPLETLQKVSSLLKSNGVCLVRIPTVSSYAWRHYGIKWVQLDAPRHFFLYSVEGMKILADRTGFELCNIVYDSTSFQFWGSEQYKMDIPLCDSNSYAMNPENSIFSRVEIADFAKRAEELNAANQGDQAIFYLRKLSTLNYPVAEPLGISGANC